MSTLTQNLLAHPCAHPCVRCGGTVALVDHTGRECVFRGVPVRYPEGSVLPTCANCGTLWFGEELYRRMTDAIDCEELYRRFLDWRQIEEPCDTCKGAGSRTYGSTSTWGGGVGGQSMTGGVCDACWGSGDKHAPWTDLRAMERTFDDRVKREALTLVERRLGLRFANMRDGLVEIAAEVEKIASKRRSPIDPVHLAGMAVARLLRDLVDAAKEPT